MELATCLRVGAKVGVDGALVIVAQSIDPASVVAKESIAGTVDDEGGCLAQDREMLHSDGGRPCKMETEDEGRTGPDE